MAPIDLQDAIQRFIARLRHRGVQISPSEAIDALRAVKALDVEQRESFKSALLTTLVKSHEYRPLFDDSFDTFFSAPASSRRGKGHKHGPGAARNRDIPRPKQASQPTDPDRERRALRTGRVLELKKQVEEKRNRSGHLRVILSPRPDRPEVTQRRHHASAEPSRKKADRLDLLRRMTPEEDRMLVQEIPRLVKQVRLKAGRRRRAASSGRPWPARVMRRSVSTGGVPFVIPSRRRPPRRPRVVVLADVSWSVMRASALFLMMAAEFLESVRGTSIHLFVDRCVDASRTMQSWEATGALSFERFLQTVEGLDPVASSDYGRAFHQAAFSRRQGVRTSRRDTLLVVLGDGRNNRRDPQEWAFEELARRCRRVIWIDPEPEHRWSTGDSDMAAYLPNCDVVCEARDLEGLARGLGEIVRYL